MEACLNSFSEKYPSAVTEVILYVNGPDMDNLLLRSKISNIIQQACAKSNLDVRLEFTPTPGKTHAVTRVYKYAKAQGKPVLMTDLDVLRLSNSMKELWTSMLQNPPKIILGSRHYVLPNEYLGQEMTSEQSFWYQVFEGDKHPNLGFPKKSKLRAGQVLINPNHNKEILQINGGADDKQLNKNTAEGERTIVENSLVFHIGRNSLIEHIRARTRYPDEYTEEPYIPEEKGLTDFINSLKNRNVDNKTINLYLLRQYLRYYVKLLLYYYFNNQLNQQTTFIPHSQNILDCDINQLLNQELSTESAKNIILSALSFEYLNIIKNLTSIDDKRITSDQSERILPDLTEELETDLLSTFSPN